MDQRERFEAWQRRFYGEVGARSLEWDERIGYVDCTVQAQFIAHGAAETAALERAWEAVHAERLEDPTDSADDIAYQRAIEDAEHAIRKLAAPVERRGDKS